MTKLIGQGAEAKLHYDAKKKAVIKKRVVKGYRLPAIDKKLRIHRMRREAKILEKIPEVAPDFISADEKEATLIMSYVDGTLVKEALIDADKKLCKTLMEETGKSLAFMHSKEVSHGDLTTSNMIWNGEKIIMIDFGLSTITLKVEDYAVDLYLFKHALESKHYQHAEELYDTFLESYKKHYSQWKNVLDRLKLVEKRGRYKRRMGS